MEDEQTEPTSKVVVEDEVVVEIVMIALILQNSRKPNPKTNTNDANHSATNE